LGDEKVVGVRRFDYGAWEVFISNTAFTGSLQYNQKFYSGIWRKK
jgi:hypothetical protein